MVAVEPKGMRTWKPPSVCEVFPDGTAPDAKLDTRQTFAEVSIVKNMKALAVFVSNHKI